MDMDGTIRELHAVEDGCLPASSPWQTEASRENMRLYGELAERDARIRQLVDANIAGIIVWNMNGDILEANDAFLRMVGYARDDLVSCRVRWQDLTPAEWLEGTEQAMKQLNAYGRTQPTEMEYVRRDGSRVSVMVGIAAFGTDGNEGVAFVVDLTERKETERRRRESCEMLQALTARYETAREEERKRIAREMHDELGQYLTALRMQASLLQKELGHEHPELAEEMMSMIAIIDETVQVVREVIASLRPAALEVGIVAAIEWLVAEFNRNGRTLCRLCVENENIEMSEERAIVLFRLAQEALTNVVRHAAANTVIITLQQSSQGCQMEIRDDGRGFHALARRKQSFGLAGMKERAMMLGGQFDIISSPGAGTSLTMKFFDH
jgi:PAS domain S-box-containing protein